MNHASDAGLPIVSKVFLVSLLPGLLACSLGCSPVTAKESDSSSAQTGTANVSQDVPPARTPEKPFRQLDVELVEAGWQRDSAAAVVTLNADWFVVVNEEHPAAFARQKALLKGLGRWPQLMPLLAQHPETAGLLAGADHPSLIAKSLESAGDDYERVAGLYVQHAAKEDAIELAQALDKNRSLVCRLQKQGLLGLEAIFLFDRRREGALEYDRWLREVVSVKLSTNEQELASFLNLVLCQGAEIRKRLAEDSAFRRRFREDIWPKLARAAGDHHNLFEPYLGDARVWDMLALDDGEKLVREWGLLPIDLLYGYDNEPKHRPYPKDLQPLVIQTMLRGDNDTLLALRRFRDEPLFHRLLKRSLSAEIQAAACNRLFAADSDYAAKLKKFDGLSDAALAEEVGPPPDGLVTWIPFYYSVWEVPKKLLQGRDVPTMEWIFAAADPILLAADVVTAGGGTAGEATFEAAGKTAATATSIDTAELAMKTVLESNAKELAERCIAEEAGKDVADKISEEAFGVWGVNGCLSKLRTWVTMQVDKALTFEITKPVQLAFRLGGFNRATFKRLTTLEARLFMRADAKVYIALSKTVIGYATTKFFKETAGSLGLGAAIESEPGQELVHRTVNAIRKTKEDVERAWRKNISAWWLINASGMAERSGGRSERSPTRE